MFVIKQPKEVLLAVDIINQLGKEPLRTKQIAEKLGEGHAFVQRIVYRLGKAGILNVVRGPGGGVLLNPTQDGSFLPLSEIYRALGRIETAEKEDSPGEVLSAVLLSYLCETPVILPKQDAYKGPGDPAALEAVSAALAGTTAEGAEANGG